MCSWSPIRHCRLVIADQEALCPAPASSTPQSPPDRVEQDVGTEAGDQRRLVQLDAPVTRLADGAEGESPVVG